MPCLSSGCTSESKLKNLSALRLRANPEYEFVPVSSVPDAAGQQLAGFDHAAGLVGVLRSRKQVGPVAKAIRQEISLLYRALEEPSYLPVQVQTELGEHCDRILAALVLDRVLEIEHNCQFVTGASAYELLWDVLPSCQPRGTIARISLEGLKMAQALATEAPKTVASRLYHYNRMPASPAWMRNLANPPAIAAYLGLGAGQGVSPLLARSWQAVPVSASNLGWSAWRLRSRNGGHNGSARMYKLYVSPRCEFMPEAFAAAVATFTDTQTPAFKVGSDVFGLLRPDKLIGYFWSYEHMLSAAEHLHKRLAGCPVHGVPFTDEIAGDGLLSWGTDPPEDESALGIGRESWRSWLVRRMATVIVEASNARLKQVEPWQVVLGRMQVDGIDTDTWTPTRDLWN